MTKLILITIATLLGMRLVTFTLGIAGVLSWKQGVGSMNSTSQLAFDLTEQGMIPDVVFPQ